MEEYEVVVKHVAPIRFKAEYLPDGSLAFNGEAYDNLDAVKDAARRMIEEHGHNVTGYEGFRHPYGNPEVRVYGI